MPAYQKPLALIDALHPALPEIDLAIALAEPTATITLIDVLPDQGWTWKMLGGKADEIRRQLKSQKESALSMLAGEQAVKRGRPVAPVVAEGKTGTAVIKEVLAGKHDLVILQAKGPHSRRAGGIGDTAWELLRKCPSSVLLVSQQEANTSPKKILVALDAAAEDQKHIALNQKIMAAAAHLAVKLGASLTAMHCWAIYGEGLVKDYMSAAEFKDIEEATRKLGEEGLQALAATLAEKPAELHLNLVRGLPNTHIPAFANTHNFDLVVMGTVARQGIAGALLGNTAEEVLPQLKTSILAIKPDDFVSPVS
ncbi:Universal stress protein E [Anatilimnocola aggregata]|uniref:Universal stress protein E n=1 Tax=Anatilimnocola aggregata TaxID=2528021 RepID=A0A517YB96_9BACT|nr:universal stress protein [Anatilimnocola aggregata]QDU27449.1 Universal stress protein E [Anatilimnocola aggregata]